MFKFVAPLIGCGTLLLFSVISPLSQVQALPRIESEKSPDEPPTKVQKPDRQALREFISKAPHLNVAAAGTKAGTPSVSESNGRSVVSAPFETTLTLDELAGFNPNHGVLWPGSLIQGKTLVTGTLAAISVPHGPQTVVLGPVVAEGDEEAIIARQIASPSLATVEQARQNILKQHLLPPAKFSFTMNQCYSLEHAMLQIGGHANYLGGSVEASLNSENYSVKNNVIVKFTQEYYTYSVEPPKNPVDFFEQDVALEDLETYTNTTDNSVTYIQSVTYGRMGFMMISSNESYESLNRSIKAAMSYAAGSAELNYTDADKKVMKESEVKLIIFGGRLGDATQLVNVNPLEHLKTWIQEKIDAKSIRFGIPISYRVNYLNNNEIARLSFTTDYRRVQVSAIPRLTNWKITFFTLDDDKDDDTHLSVVLYREVHPRMVKKQFLFITIEVKEDPDEIKYEAYEQNGKSEYHNNSTHPEILTEYQPIYTKNLDNKLKLRITITPNGNDTWRFKYRIEATRSDGGQFIRDSDNLQLSQDNRQGEYSLFP
jgi:thiol-activated cytolysin